MSNSILALSLCRLGSARSVLGPVFARRFSSTLFRFAFQCCFPSCSYLRPLCGRTTFAATLLLGRDMVSVDAGRADSQSKRTDILCMLAIFIPTVHHAGALAVSAHAKWESCCFRNADVADVNKQLLTCLIKLQRRLPSACEASSMSWSSPCCSRRSSNASPLAKSMRIPAWATVSSSVMSDRRTTANTWVCLLISAARGTLLLLLASQNKMPGVWLAFFNVAPFSKALA